MLVLASLVELRSEPLALLPPWGCTTDTSSTDCSWAVLAGTPTTTITTTTATTASEDVPSLLTANGASVSATEDTREGSGAVSETRTLPVPGLMISTPSWTARMAARVRGLVSWKYS